MNDSATALSPTEPVQDPKELLKGRDEEFWRVLSERSSAASSFNELLPLSNLRKRARKIGFENGASDAGAPLRVALVGGSTLYPLSDLIEHMIEMNGSRIELMTGDFDNYRSEILDEESRLYRFKPELVVIIPDDRSCRYTGRLTDPGDLVRTAAERVSGELLGFCGVLRERTGAELILCNFILPSYIDLGPLRTKSPASDWNFRKSVNYHLAVSAPNFVHICDLEFLAYRLGGLDARDERAWFESKQLCAPALQVSAAKEIAHLAASIKRSPKKVLVLDLDNTLWGGVIGDDGMEGIEIGDTSPRGEAFKAFQSYVLSLTERGVLLGVCSKNDLENAIEPFRSHPEMVLKEEHFVSFKANWEPKANNLIQMADELNLGLDSFVFVDDNPAEVEIVRQFAPDVTAILLDPDPSAFVRQLQESRLFERFSITEEDSLRTEQYRKETERRSMLESAVDMDSYLASLEMKGVIKEFNPLDLPRIAQLINKSNQFNLTTKRRSESDIESLMSDEAFTGFTVRLSDRFGDHGLIAIVICEKKDKVFEVDTWLMSCRVLKRQVEDEVINEIVRLAGARGCDTIRGIYLPTAKNGMVKQLYPDLGFSTIKEDDQGAEYELSVDSFETRPTYILVESRP